MNQFHPELCYSLGRRKLMLLRDEVSDEMVRITHQQIHFKYVKTIPSSPRFLLSILSPYLPINSNKINLSHPSLTFRKFLINQFTKNCIPNPKPHSKPFKPLPFIPYPISYQPFSNTTPPAKSHYQKHKNPFSLFSCLLGEHTPIVIE